MKAAALDHIHHLILGIFALRRSWLRHARPELNVGSATGHIGGDRYRTGLSGEGDDLGFALVVLRVQNVVRNPPALEHSRERLRYLDAYGTNQHRESERV